MKLIYNVLKLTFLMGVLLVLPSCNDLLEEPAENTVFTGATDYTNTGNMILPIMGVYAGFQDFAWENYPLISVRGDDVNAGGLGDQQDFGETDKFNYNKDYWMYNAVWQNFYKDVYTSLSAIEEIKLYQENASNKALADQYMAEAKVVQAFSLLQLARLWGNIVIPTTPDPSDLYTSRLSTKEEVMQFISGLMDEAIPVLPDLRPNERTDIRGGVTRHTALAIKAMANLELKNYPEVAQATSQIISSGRFSLAPKFYDLFKIAGKLSDENLYEFQYSDFGQGTGDVKSFPHAFFGPENWTPSRTGASSGWGFFEPSLKYIKFMLDRGETERLETSVLFTNRGIDELKKDPKYATLPAFVSNRTREGDVINNFNRAMFVSGKHYLPSAQLTQGRTEYGTNKNFIVIRYAQVLLMHAEALTRGATGTGMTADEAVNTVRTRAGLAPLTGVTSQQVMDEKYAELAMEWGIRYYDMIRLGNYQELNYDGRTFSEDKVFLPLPQNQVDLLPVLGDNQEQ
ncbi:MAG: RagB/SusD family nutrient uptake outer membrane protein [Verrucomicrobia bacterium]|nr:RagB/SusD family nutrient uptake outer membrane protein [Prolixibacteraceae bacterium]